MSTGDPIYLVSACTSGEEFVAAFRRYADRNGLFIPMADPIPAGRRGLFALTLKDGGRAGGISPARHRPRHILAVSEVALAMTLLVVSGLMIRTFVAMRQVQPGFTRPQNVQTFRVAIPPRLLTDPEQVARVVRVAVRRGDDGAADVCGDIACFGSGATACDLRPRATGVPRRSGRCAARRRLALIDVIGHVCPVT